uniref:Uncharacterized protein n=1 Tax=Glossina austeni TaxID=7395 RepID=A0A1A9V9Q4_GLOAU
MCLIHKISGMDDYVYNDIDIASAILYLLKIEQSYLVNMQLRSMAEIGTLTLMNERIKLQDQDQKVLLLTETKDAFKCCHGNRAKIAEEKNDLGHLNFKVKKIRVK